MPWKETTIMEQKIEFICEWRTGKHKRVHPNLDLSGFLGGGQGRPQPALKTHAEITQALKPELVAGFGRFQLSPRSSL